ncbi:MAG: YicC/YloC family endoribonuclease [Methyloceanibacter sp.]
MTLKSMTGFARTDGVHKETSWHWEARSVNGRSLELRLRLPAGFEALVIGARSLCQERLARGNCSVMLSLKRETGQTQIRLNEAALGQALAVAQRALAVTRLEPARLDTLLAMRGVVEVVEGEDDEAARAELGQVLLAGLGAALVELVAARRAEGERLERVIAQQLAAIGSLAQSAASTPGRSPQSIAARLAEQLARLSETGAPLDPERLHQEAVLLASKADIREELDRLGAHVAAAKELLNSDQPVGRKFEFLAQEFNREANTICSKAGDVETSRIGLELKSVIDQLREQVQNIE